MPRAASTTSPPTHGPADVRRLTRPGWQHPRTLGGIALVAVAAVLGALLVTSVADTTTVWTVRTDVRAGQPVSETVLEPTEARLPDGSLGSYALASEDLSADTEAVWAHAMPAGSLVPRSAVTSVEASEAAELPVPVAAGSMPADLAAGDRVDVWVAPHSGERGPARRVLRDVVVASVGEPDAFSGDPAGHVLVDVPSSRDTLAGAIGALGDGRVTLVRVRGDR
ncbi:hypothetical protein CLV56_2802 [Mumia flava]|uniref:SAF domain-containing protein n=1 Tax=Mumia flava TaxID=1348852 RepID=A0A0B2BN19_9ACTN|nr:hypothetical protein [Mumia flava]PJJ58551.1 hypothetical protein CLV56_2802 [Mumia flava]